MKKITTVNSGRSDAITKIEVVEAKYNAKFVGQFCLKTRNGCWAEDSAADVYWQANPPVEGYSNYFGLIIQNGTLYITSGASGVEPVITGVVADDGEIIYSRFRHDYRVSTDKSVFIDGGRDYTKTGTLNRCVNLKVIDGEFYELEASDFEVDEPQAEESTWYEP